LGLAHDRLLHRGRRLLLGVRRGAHRLLVDGRLRSGRGSRQRHRAALVAGQGLPSGRTGMNSKPSGMCRYPGAVPPTAVWPYCQTIFFVRGSMTTTRSLKSSPTITSPLGSMAARLGWSSIPGPEDGRYDHMTAPVWRFRMTTPPGRA